jgi:hypothetical protein
MEISSEDNNLMEKVLPPVEQVLTWLVLNS